MKFASRVQTTEGRRSLKLSKALLAAALAVGCARAQAQEVDNRAGEWRITPRISLGSTYSDNIRLAPANAEHDLLFHVDPGLSVRKRGGRLDLRLDYTAQGLLYTNNGDASTINNELQAFGTAELLQKNLFLDAYGLISQVAVSSNGRTDAGNLGSAGGVPSGLSVFSNFDLGLPGGRDLFNPLTIFNDIALTDNQATGYRFGISPYWRQNLGGWADVLLRYRYDTVFYDEESNVDSQQPDVRLSLIHI